MALQPKLIACGKSVATFSMAVRFLTGPAVIAATSIAVGIRGVLLHVAIVQVTSNSIYQTIYSSVHVLINLYNIMFNFCRLHFHKVLFPLCLPKNTISIQIYSVLGQYHFIFIFIFIKRKCKLLCRFIIIILKDNLLIVQGYFWNVDCIAYYNNLLCASWSIAYFGCRNNSCYCAAEDSNT